MRINDFLAIYNLHDSLLDKVTFNNNHLKLSIDFCFWMQKDYRDSEPETGLIDISFGAISDYKGPIGKIDNFSILEVNYSNNNFSLLLLDDFNDISTTLSFHTESDSLNFINKTLSSK